MPWCLSGERPVCTSKRLNWYKALLPAVQHGYPWKAIIKIHLTCHSWCMAVQECRVALDTRSSDLREIPQHHRSPGMCRDWPLASCYSNLGDMLAVLNPLVNPSGASMWEPSALSNLPVIQLGTAPSLHESKSGAIWNPKTIQGTCNFLAFASCRN